MYRATINLHAGSKSVQTKDYPSITVGSASSSDESLLLRVGDDKRSIYVFTYDVHSILVEEVDFSSQEKLFKDMTFTIK